MKYFMICLVLSFALVGCNAEGNSNQNSTEKTQAKKEDFSATSYANFPTVPNAVKKLKVDIAQVKVLQDNANVLEFAIPISLTEADSSRAELINEYIQSLIVDGYSLDDSNGDEGNAIFLSKDSLTCKILNGDSNYYKEFKKENNSFTEQDDQIYENGFLIFKITNNA